MAAEEFEEEKRKIEEQSFRRHGLQGRQEKPQGEEVPQTGGEYHDEVEQHKEQQRRSLVKFQMGLERILGRQHSEDEQPEEGLQNNEDEQSQKERQDVKELSNEEEEQNGANERKEKEEQPQQEQQNGETQQQGKELDEYVHYSPFDDEGILEQVLEAEVHSEWIRFFDS